MLKFARLTLRRHSGARRRREPGIQRRQAACFSGFQARRFAAPWNDRGGFGGTNPGAHFGETNPRLPEPSDSNYDAYKWIAGDVNSAFLENGLVREKSYVW